MAAMRAVLESGDAAGLDAALAAARARWGPAALAPLLAHLGPEAAERVRRVAAAVDHAARDATPEAALARLAESFDRAAAVSPEAGAALYSLGDPQLLAAVTAEVAHWLRAERLLRPGDRLLEVGCGAGRHLRALADGPAAASLALGVEISPAMAREAARRLADLPHVRVVQGSGQDLAFVADASIDLVLYADSFPYVVQAGGDLPARHLAECARVLRPNGRAVILNWSYGEHPETDFERLRAEATRWGLNGGSPIQPGFAGWDARCWLLKRAEGKGRDVWPIGNEGDFPP